MRPFTYRKVVSALAVSLGFALLISAAWTAARPQEDPFRLYLPLMSRSPLSVQVLPDHTTFRTDWGSQHILGEVMNTGFDPVRDVRVGVTITNPQGQQVAYRSMPVYLENLPPGVKTCFDITFDDAPSAWLSYPYYFEAPVFTASSRGLPNIPISTSVGSNDQTHKEYKVYGQVRNLEPQRMHNVHVAGSLYTSSGKLIGCSNTYVTGATGSDLEFTSYGNFEMYFFGRGSYEDAASFILQADGAY